MLSLDCEQPKSNLTGEKINESLLHIQNTYLASSGRGALSLRTFAPSQKQSKGDIMRHGIMAETI